MPRKVVGVNLFALDFNQTAGSVAAGGTMSCSCTNIYDSATDQVRSFTLQYVNGTTSRSGAQCIPDVVAAFRAAILAAGARMEVLQSASSIVLVYEYPDEGPFPSVPVNVNNGYYVNGANVTMLGELIGRLTGTISTLEGVVASKDLDLASKDRIIAELSAGSGEDTPAGAGSTVVSIEQPAEKDYASIALAAVAGFGLGRMQAETEPRKRRV